MTCADGKPRPTPLGLVPRRGPLVTLPRVDAGKGWIGGMTRQGTRGGYTTLVRHSSLGDRAILAFVLCSRVKVFGREFKRPGGGERK